MVKEVFMKQLYNNLSHPILFLLKVIAVLLIVLCSGPAYMPFMIMACSFSVFSINSEVNYYLPMSNENRLKYVKTEILYKGITCSVILVLAMARLRWLPFFKQRQMVYSPVYIVCEAALLVALCILMAIEMASGVNKKGFTYINDKGEKKRKLLSIENFVYCLSLLAYIAIGIFTFAAENKAADRKLVGEPNIIMLIACAISAICLVYALRTINKIEIGDHTGVSSNSLIDAF